MSRLQTFYKESVMPELQKQFNYSNVMEVPKITKITQHGRGRSGG